MSVTTDITTDSIPRLQAGSSPDIPEIPQINSHNLCVAGETVILTRKGYFPIADFQDREVEIWNGTDWSKVMVRQTAPARHLITIFFSNGRSLTCTPDHKFIIGSENPLNQAKRIPAQFLAQGMELRQEALPLVEGETPFEYPYIHGALCSFGCFTEKGPIIDIMGPALPIIINHPDMITTESGTKIFPDNLPRPYSVPINSSVDIKLKWLAGFLDARAFISKVGMTLINVNDQLFQDIQLLLTTLGARSIIENNSTVKVPIDNGKLISIRNYGLIIPWEEFDKLTKLGLNGLYSKMKIPDESQVIPLVIKDVVDIGRVAPAYSFTEPVNNAGVYNGILTG